MAKTFEELESWQLAVALDAKVYHFVTDGKLKTVFSLRDQTLRSVGSIADNIAEGFERGGNKEFIQPGQRRGLIDEKNFTGYYNECRTVSVKIGNLITYLKNSDLKGNKYK